MKIRIVRNYKSPDIIRQTPGSNGIWKELEFSEEKIKSCDLLVILNRPTENLNIEVRKKGVWAFIQEPPFTRNRHIKKYFKYYDLIYSAYPQIGIKYLKQPPCLPWLIDKSYDELKNLNLELINKGKNDKVSWITSNRNVYPGHKIRLDFIKHLKQYRFAFDLYGKGFNPIKDKYEGLETFKYTISAENFISDNYFTEKLIDPLLSWTMPFYYGCPNYYDFIPKEAVIQIDLRNKEAAVETMEHAIRNNLWKKNIEAISYARELILDKYNFFPFVYEQLKEFDLSEQKKNVFIPSDGMNSFERNIRSIFNKIRK